jgi:N-acetylglucosaminyldiphosphoundecaprenol N-acetyl-beta-D-mannosaminyltransferase
MPLVWLGKLMGIPLPERVAGASLFEALGEGPGEPLTVFFFGGSQGAAESARRQLACTGKSTACVGCEFPGFGSVQEMSRPDIIERINAAKPDVLVVSLGARKGQAWIERNRHRLEAPVISHLGAVVDFAAGRRKRAPGWMQRAGLEWLWRIKEDPQLWRRYLRDGVTLTGLVVTRVLPWAWYRGRHEARSCRAVPAKVQTRQDGQTFVVRLHGAWTRSNAGPLRECLGEASALVKDVRLDLRGVTYVDSAVLGLLMILEGHQQERGRKFVIAPLPASVRRIFDLYGAEYLYR